MEKHHQEAAVQRRLGGWMFVGFWILLLVFFVVLFRQMLEQQRNPNQDVVTHVGNNGVREVTLTRNRMGHYNVTGSINGHIVEFMLDTGSTDIAIPSSLERTLGLKRLGRVEFNTANGLAEGYATRLQEVRVGSIVLHDLSASINPHMEDNIVLLGMSFLKKIDFSQHGDNLILQQ